jgi:N-acetylglucosaminyldiphosphoundecaprenol N-acetyl-beta-D-mannosaminyltransferase
MPEILGVRVDPVTMTVALQQCWDWLKLVNTGPKVVFTPNPEILVYAEQHQDFKHILNQSDLAIADGAGLVRLSGGALPERVTGTDLMQAVLNELNQRPQPVGFILQPHGLTNRELLTATLQRRWPNLIAQIIYSDESVTSRTLNAAAVFVALGCPAQEHWCIAQRAQLPHTRLLMTVGGGVDFLTGQARRAPSFFRVVGLEWLWRVARQPSRWRRILTATIIFPWYVWTRSRKS